MKRVLFIIACLITFVGTVNAVSLELIDESDTIYSSKTTILDYRGGSLFINTESGDPGYFGALLNYSDSKKIVKTKEFTDLTLESVAVDGDNIYAYGYKRLSNPYYNARYLFILDKDFNIVNEVDVRPFVDQYGLGSTYNIGKAIFKDNKFIILLYYTNNGEKLKVMTVSKNLSIESVTDYEDSQYKNDIMPYNSLEMKYGKGKLIASDNSTNCSSVFIDRACYGSELKYVDQNNKTKWEQDFTNYEGIRDIKYNDYHIFVATMSGKLVILYPTGEIAQVVKDLNINSNLYLTNDYLAVAKVGTPGQLCTMAFNEYDRCEDAMKLQIYHLSYHIKSKVTKGKGNVEVIGKSDSGEGVTFKVTPEEGYVLGRIKVTDANGNVVYFTNNTFTMPHADVTIEVEFLVANANTTDAIILTATLLFILSFIVIMVQRKKLEV